jgi:hypothetical protein
MASSYFLFWPYHLLNWTTFSIFRWITRETPFDEVAPGLFVGGRLLSGDEARFKERGILSVLDLTAEFSEVHFLRSSASYLCIPLLDRSDPTMGELNVGVDFIIQRLSSGPVYMCIVPLAMAAARRSQQPTCCGRPGRDHPALLLR